MGFLIFMLDVYWEWMVIIWKVIALGPRSKMKNVSDFVLNHQQVLQNAFQTLKNHRISLIVMA